MLGVLAKEIALARDGGAIPHPSKIISTNGLGRGVASILMYDQSFAGHIMRFLQLQQFQNCRGNITQDTVFA